MNKTRLSIVTALAFSAAFAHEALACDALVAGARGVVVAVTDGDTFILDNGEKVRLIGMQAPKLPLGREGFETWPFAPQAKRSLEEMVLGEEVELRFGGARRDRHDRALAHAFLVESGDWVQHEMVAAGLARVYSFPDNRSCVAELLATEAQARVERNGIWRDPYYALRSAAEPDALLERLGQYELVEGRVLMADRAGSRVYLNFGRVWRTDFTVVIAREGVAAFQEAEFDPLMLEGSVIRVRGWIDAEDGPRIEVTHPEQIEVLAAR